MRSTTHSPEPLLVTKTEAAAILGVHRATVNRLIKSGTLPTIRLAAGMRPRIRRDDLLELARRGDP
jgi:excisionase family DNA binding protein